MIYGGKVFRVVTENYPGDPALAAAGAAPIRTEYVAEDFGYRISDTGKQEPNVRWTDKSAEAFVYPTHLAAAKRAHEISARCHASVTPLDNLRAVAASSTGAVKQAVSVETSVELNSLRRDRAPRPQNSLPVPVVAGAQPVRPETAGHCVSVRGTTRSFPANVKPDSRGGQNSGIASRNAPRAPRRDGSVVPDSERFWYRQGQMA